MCAVISSAGHVSVSDLRDSNINLQLSQQLPQWRGIISNPYVNTVKNRSVKMTVIYFPGVSGCKVTLLLLLLLLLPTGAGRGVGFTSWRHLRGQRRERGETAGVSGKCCWGYSERLTWGQTHRYYLMAHETHSTLIWLSEVKEHSVYEWSCGLHQFCALLR